MHKLSQTVTILKIVILEIILFGMISYIKNFCKAAALLVSIPAFADEIPLDLEELLTNKGKIKLEASVSYANTENRRSEVQALVGAYVNKQMDIMNSID